MMEQQKTTGPRLRCARRIESLLPDSQRVNVPRVVSADRPRSKPKLGQHFLNSEEYARRIVEALGDVSQSTVLEVGPGRGILTSMLAQRARRLIAVELDRVLAAQLRLKFGMYRNVEVIEADVLAIDIDSLFGPKPGLGRPGIELKPEPVKVVGNLPYYITSDILLRLFQFSKYFDSMVLMVQREVADRIAAEPGGRDYGVLSATTQLHARVEKLFTVPPGAFSPPPKVFSAVLRLTVDPQQEKLGVAGDGFINFLRLSFGQKRKTLWNNLKGNYDEAHLKHALAQAKVKPTARAETLSLGQSAAVYRALRDAQTEP
jgi:16S rRNA (adenine1518-N6/adenine1519-N6)-dimethyltransferase